MTIARERIARKLFLALVFSLPILLPSPLTAQISPRLDVFGGYSFRRFDSPTIGFADYKYLSGWNADVTGNITKKWGVTLDVSGHYGSQLTLYSFMLGPQYTWQRERSRFFVHGLFGKEQNKVNSSQLTNSDFESVGRAFGGGGGFDLDWKPRISIRVVQADYLRTNTYGVDQNDIRISTGVVIHFGQIGHRPKL